MKWKIKPGFRIMMNKRIFEAGEIVDFIDDDLKHMVEPVKAERPPVIQIEAEKQLESEKIPEEISLNAEEMNGIPIDSEPEQDQEETMEESEETEPEQEEKEQNKPAKKRGRKSS